MAEIFRNFIGGKWVESRSGRTFERKNPATGELVGTFTKSNAEDVNDAVAAASKAFKSWRLYPAPSAARSSTGRPASSRSARMSLPGR